jgi:UDP-N-acetyl-D-mannosaminuronate dehydrogenase
MQTIPKVVSGLDDLAPGSLNTIMRLYSKVFDTVYTVSKPEVAEMMKLYENCQRMMCIAYANEMADACIPHGIDPYEVCRAAATKPFGYMPFTPSLGVGGHCIPVNPYYLLSNSEFPLLKAATEKMWQRPAEIGRRALDSLFNVDNVDDSCARPLVQHTDSGIDLTFDQTAMNQLVGELESAGVNKLADSQARRASAQESSYPHKSKTTLTPRASVLVVGVGFKAGQNVLSNSPGHKLLQSLAVSGRVDVMFADPLVKQSSIPRIPRLNDKDWNKQVLETFDLIIVSVKQIGIDFSVLEQLSDVKVQMWCT